MRYNNKQSGFTPTPNLTQSMAKRFKRYIYSRISRLGLTTMRREQSSPRENWCRGFSLVETLVSITILLIVIVGPMTIVSSAARSTSFASEQVTAFFLAQEGAELVEKVRNDLLLQYFVNANPGDDPWSDFTDGAFFQDCFNDATNNNPNGCSFEVGASGLPSNPISCDTLADCNIYLDTTAPISRSAYTLTETGNTETIFTRQIILVKVAGNNNEVKVTSRVTWRSGSVREDQVVNVETRLFNLYENN